MSNDQSKAAALLSKLRRVLDQHLTNHHTYWTFDKHEVGTLIAILSLPSSRDDGLEEAAKWHDKQIAKLQRQSKRFSKSHPQIFSDIKIGIHKESAAAIRALKSTTPAGVKQI